MSLSDEITKKLNVFFADKPLIVAAYVYGSWIQNRQRRDSDLDIAVLLDEIIEKSEWDTFIESVFLGLSRLLRQDIHLLILNDSSYVVRIQVLTRGMVVHSKNLTKLSEFRTTSLSLYADFGPTLRHMENRLAGHIGGRHG